MLGQGGEYFLTTLFLVAHHMVPFEKKQAYKKLGKQKRSKGGRLSIGGEGADRAPWLPPLKKGSIDGTPKLLPRLTPGSRR